MSGKNKSKHVFDVLMSFIENNLLRRITILATGLLSIPISYLADSAVTTPHPFYQAWVILSIALWVIISGVVYFIFFSIRIRNGTLKMRRPPRYDRRR